MFPAFLAFTIDPVRRRRSRCSAGRSRCSSPTSNVGILFFLAMGSIAVYGVVLAGWSSGSNYPLLGAVRSTAQMISYEIAMGLALVAVLMYTGTLSISEIVDGAGRVWNIVPQFPAFLIFLICAIAETNRPPFDLARGRDASSWPGTTPSTPASSSRCSSSASTCTSSRSPRSAVTLFLGGWRGPASGLPPAAVADPVVPAEGHRRDLRLRPGSGPRSRASATTG